MKGIIIEKGHDYSVLLLSDGTFRNVKNCKSQEVGDVIYTRDVVSGNLLNLKRVASMIAAIFIVVFLGTGAYIWVTPVQYINIDINPSVELMINRLDRIIKVKSLNDDGKMLIQNISVNAQHYEMGISEVIDTARSLGYLEDEDNVLISISSSDIKRSEKTQEKIKEKVDEKVEILTFDTDAHKVSVEEGLSPGKSNIIDKVIETGTELSKEELAAIPVKDLMMKIKENKDIEKSSKAAGIKESLKNESTGLDEQNTNSDDKTKKGNEKDSKPKPNRPEKSKNNKSNNENKEKGVNFSDNKTDKKDEKTRNKNSEEGQKNNEINVSENKNIKNSANSKINVDIKNSNDDKAGTNNNVHKDGPKNSKNNEKNDNKGLKTEKTNDNNEIPNKNKNKEDNDEKGLGSKKEKESNNKDNKSKLNKQKKDSDEKITKTNIKDSGNLKKDNEDIGKNNSAKGKSNNSKIRD